MYTQQEGVLFAAAPLLIWLCLCWNVCGFFLPARARAVCCVFARVIFDFEC